MKHSLKFGGVVDWLKCEGVLIPPAYLNSLSVGDANMSELASAPNEQFSLEVDKTSSSTRIAVIPHYLAMTSYVGRFVERPENNLQVPLKKIWNERKVGDCYWFALRPTIVGMCGMVGTPIGLAFIRGWADNWDEKVFGIVVDQDHRGWGIGSLLLQTAIVEAKLRGLGSLRLHVDEKNAAALKLYAKFNFLPDDLREDRQLIMRKVL
jgi:ribosomal protein S18 acetylase RimI-like enzyme